VTIARSKRDEPDEAAYRFLQAHGRDELGEWRLADVRLFKSELGPHGPTYEALHVAPLEG
jgi:2'-5' RNA ligase